MFLGIFGWFKKVFKHIGDAIVAFVKSDAAQAILKTLEGQIINAVVTTLAGQNYASLTSSQKREEAFRQIKSQLLAAGLDARDSAIALGIEVAVANLKNLGTK